MSPHVAGERLYTQKEVDRLVNLGKAEILEQYADHIDKTTRPMGHIIPCQLTSVLRATAIDYRKAGEP